MSGIFDTFTFGLLDRIGVLEKTWSGGVKFVKLN